MRANRKKLIFVLAVVVFAILWIVAHAQINQLMESRYGYRSTKTYSMGETIPLKDNVIMDSTADGYEVSIDTAEILSLDECFALYGNAKLDDPPEKVMAITMIVSNEGNEMDGIFLPDLILHTIDNYTDFNYELTTQANEFFRNSPDTYGILVPSGESAVVRVIYNLRESNFSATDWKQLTESDFYLRITNFPDRQDIILG